MENIFGEIQQLSSSQYVVSVIYYPFSVWLLLSKQNRKFQINTVDDVA